ncbi:MAG: AmmeMemoRadiSam system radical SAM enzyme [Candidatus Omnitrophica bacterium]|nr:AmmeMemoRadiSam system radical SAM enzyme [Candidatus Omnitrophota bacterium]
MKLSFGIILFVALISTCLYTSRLPATAPLKEALFYDKLNRKEVQCKLCPRQCVVSEGKRGYCGIRENQGGRLYTLSYGKLVSLNDLDPIEKKPLFHFLPNTLTFSVATAGCNLKCKFCQNWEISQRLPEEVDYTYITPEELVKEVKASGRPSIAYTYTEPTIFYEYILETAKLAKAQGIKNVMHSNGYINEEPLRQLCKYLDAVNIDLKGFNDDYYARLSEGTLDPVLRSLKILKQAKVHLEITNLVLSGFNDDQATIKKMCLWIKDNLGAETPLHFSRFYPMYKMVSLNPTPVEVLENARRIALESGLKYVYIGNIAGNPAENTFCPKCKKIVIARSGYMVSEINLVDGKCKFCGERIEGVWR